MPLRDPSAEAPLRPGAALLSRHSQGNCPAHAGGAFGVPLSFRSDLTSQASPIPAASLYEIVHPLRTPNGGLHVKGCVRNCKQPRPVASWRNPKIHDACPGPNEAVAEACLFLISVVGLGQLYTWYGSTVCESYIYPLSCGHLTLASIHTIKVLHQRIREALVFGTHSWHLKERHLQTRAL